MPRQPKVYRRKRGFSLLELSIVIALLAFIATLSYSFIQKAAHSGALLQEVERLYAVLLFMKRKACLEGKPCCVTFDLVRNQYTADRTYTLSNGVVFGFIDGMLGPPASPTTPLKEAITWPQKRIVFYPEGLADTPCMSAGAVYLTTPCKSCVYALTSDASAVSRIRRYRYRSSWILF